MDRQAFRRTSSGTGLLFDGRDPSTRQYLGSCFSVIEPTVFVTAAHCVDGRDRSRLWVNHHGGPSPDLFTPVHRVETAESTDIAVLRTDAPRSQWAFPFPRLRYTADLGEDVCAYGYPQDLIGPAPAKETPRFFRGFLQRPFDFQRPGSERRYAAYELSFPCPPGLSGGPLFLAVDPGTVIGVVTENFETFTVEHEVIEEEHSDVHVRHEARRVITYGVAATIFYAIPELEDVLGFRLPDPEPERVV